MSIGPRPVWLTDEVDIASLLNAVLDRFDRQPGDARQRQVILPAEKYLQSLGHADALSDQLWAMVRELERLGLLRIRPASRNSFDHEWKAAKLAFAPASEPVLREWLGRERTERAMQLWRRAVESQAGAFPRGCEALLNRRVVIRGHSPEEVVAAFASIAALKGPLTLRQLSAAVFWGDSKVLDNRADLIAGLFPELEIRERPLVISVFLPQLYQGTLFIENQDTYVTAVDGFPEQCRNLALVYAAGFRGAASYIRARTSVLLHYAGPGAAALQPQFERWWFERDASLGPCALWGDLDFAGMQILKALRSRFEGLTAWRPGYELMLETLRKRGGYSSSAATDPAQTDPQFTGCPFADSVLLPAIRQYGQFDQESTALPT